ncbi:cytochrome c oxidase assembly protein [Pseudoalteromonas sp. T1lg10]|uniref:cytochrome c oxidase assembly protein n=1 Tax=Pseudoalteromonas sp. T1lg10 TaxID=2077093 RepID=UPI000CF60BCB|nr:cytochrome c oxidase assembly protein [Pseudoalteromonas sp. T1lg10]
MNHMPLLRKLLLGTLAMFAFAFALVPLYDVFCDVTGLNGKPSMEQAQQSERVDNSREVTVSFTTHAQSGAPFKVSAKQQSVVVKPGEMNLVTFAAVNTSDQARVMQAIPSVSPGLAAKYLHKLACFCFDQQTLQANEQQEYQLRFYVDPALPPEYEELTLSYTLFDISAKHSESLVAAAR